MRRFVLAAFVVAWAVPAAADFMSGNDLHRFCLGGTDDARAFSVGVADTYELLVKKDGATGFFCLPEDVKARQLGDVFCKFLAENPANRHEGAAGLAAVSFAEAWPCR